MTAAPPSVAGPAVSRTGHCLLPSTLPVRVEPRPCGRLSAREAQHEAWSWNGPWLIALRLRALLLRNAVSPVPPVAQTRIMSNCMAEQIARVVSFVFHPFVIAVATLAVVLNASGLERPEWIRWFLLALGTTVIPLLARLILRYWRVGGDFDVFHRNQRNTVYVLAGLCLGVLVVVVTLFDAPVLLRALVYAALPAIAVAAMINRFTKISVHAMLMAGGGTLIGLLYPGTWPWIILLTGLQGWSRVYLGKHTPTQVMLGWLVGISAVTTVFARLASAYL